MAVTSSNQVGTNRYELEISVGSELFAPAVDRAFRKNASKINVPGFRRGKAPRGTIEKIYGKEIFYEDAINELYPTVYEAAVDEAGIEPVDKADVEVLSVDENGFVFKASVTVKPEVSLEGYNGIAVDKTVRTVADSEVDEQISRMQERAARIVDVEDRGAENGDMASIDFEGFIDGEPFEGGKAEGHSLTIGSGHFIPGFEEQIAGHKAGDIFDVNVTFPEDYHAEDIKGKPAVFKVTLHNVQHKELPALDDEFVKDVSEFDTLDQLRDDTRTKLQEQADKTSGDEMENALVDAVIAKMQAEIPEVMVENKIDDMVQDFGYRLQGQGLNLETYLQYTGMETGAFRKTFAESADRQVRIRLALEKIAALENVTVSEEDIAAEFDKLAEMYGIEAEKVKAFVSEKQVKMDLAVNKAIDIIRDNAVITEKAAEDAPATDSTGEDPKKDE